MQSDYIVHSCDDIEAEIANLHGLVEQIFPEKLLPEMQPMNHEKQPTNHEKRQRQRAELTTPRWAIKQSEVMQLNEIFKTIQKPSLAMRQALAEQMGVTPRQISVWFRNRRQRVRLSKMTGKQEGESKPLEPIAEGDSCEEEIDMQHVSSMERAVSPTISESSDGTVKLESVSSPLRSSEFSEGKANHEAFRPTLPAESTRGTAKLDFLGSPLMSESSLGTPTPESSLPLNSGLDPLGYTLMHHLGGQGGDNQATNAGAIRDLEMLQQASLLQQQANLLKHNAEAISRMMGVSPNVAEEMKKMAQMIRLQQQFIEITKGRMTTCLRGQMDPKPGADSTGLVESFMCQHGLFNQAGMTNSIPLTDILEIAMM